MILILLFVALAGNFNMLISEMIEIPTLGRTFMFEYIEQLVFQKNANVSTHYSTEVLLNGVVDCCKMNFSNRRECQLQCELLFFKD